MDELLIENIGTCARILQFLLQIQKFGNKFDKGAINTSANKFEVTRLTVPNNNIKEELLIQMYRQKRRVNVEEYIMSTAKI